MVKNLPANAGDSGLIPGSERSPGGGHGNPLQYSCMENHALRTWLSDWHFHFAPRISQRKGREFPFSKQFHELTCQSLLLTAPHSVSDYCASKFAAYGFAESLHFELRLLQKSKINTTIVCPYFIKTGMFEGCSTK